MFYLEFHKGAIEQKSQVMIVRHIPAIASLKLRVLMLWLMSTSLTLMHYRNIILTVNIFYTTVKNKENILYNSL